MIDAQAPLDHGRAPPCSGPAGYVRWVICALLFFAATINYIDRQVIGILKPTLQAEFGWSEIDYADIVFAFQLAYAGGFLIAGRMMDRLGARLGFTIAIVLWSLAAIAHAEADGVRSGGRGAAVAGRTDLLRVGRRVHGGALRARHRRGGEFPGGDQGHGRMVPETRARAGHGHLQLRHQRRRAGDAAGRAVDHAHRGAGTGRLSPPALLGFLWLAFWLPLYRRPDEHPRLSAAELRPHPQRSARSRGPDSVAASCCRIARPGRS